MKFVKEKKVKCKIFVSKDAHPDYIMWHILMMNHICHLLCPSDHDTFPFTSYIQLTQISKKEIKYFFLTFLFMFFLCVSVDSMSSFGWLNVDVTS